MKVLLIGALLTVDMPGPYVAERLQGKPSSVIAKGGSSQYNWNSPFVIQDALYYLHYLSKRVSSIVTSLKVLLTQPASIECTLDHMQPFLAPNSVIVMDNCRIHKHPDIQNLIESQ